MTHTAVGQWRQRLGKTWAALEARERRGVVLAGAVVGLALLWWLVVAPPLAVLKSASAERDALRVQTAHMQKLRQEADTLQALPKLRHDDAWLALEQATEAHLSGVASLNRTGEQVQVTLDGAAAGDLAQWLAAARINARAIPSQARLQQAAAPEPGTPQRWSGTLMLTLPP